MNSSSSFKDKIVLITGAARGIGRATAIEFAKKKAKVIAVSRTENDLIDLQKEYPNNVEIWPFDITGDAFFREMSALKKLDVCINNAGINKPRLIEDVDDETLDLMLNLNVRATFRTSKYAVKIMKNNNQGVIINVTSQMGHIGSPTRTVYCLTKHAVEGLTKALAVEVAPSNIRVCSIAPTFADTPMTKPMFEDEKFKNFVYGMIPMKKLVDVQDIVDGILYLCSPQAKMITGTSLLIDGGWTAH
ncbi:MAG: SDR family oxidoreductase [Rhizobiales bacterium]|nr:3-oxoacyl-ACP reductase [Rhodobiaceae bacterium]MBL6770048.1 SDR family oxidoreductase [Hyphomicrobiales bacterium]RPF97267.1 MAG: SDR family oxidoreductase [Rhizobiales bacterium TMED227]